MELKLKRLLKRAVSVADWRGADIDTEDGTVATTDLDQMILLQEAIINAFGLDAKETSKIYNEIDKL